VSLVESIRYQVARPLRHIHPKSSPFLSGDTFRSLCDVVIDARAAVHGVTQMTNLLTAAIAKKSQGSLRAFVELDLLSLSDGLGRILETLALTAALNRRRQMILLFHNGDKTPDAASYSQLVNHGYKVFSVNVSSDMSDVSPLPIGLENRWRLKNGLVGPLKRAAVQRHCARSKIDFAAFDIHTNFEERSKASRACLNAGMHVYRDRVSPRAHRQLLLDHRFVISPPGNGLDCHRTWEAIYLGCVPVVLKTTLPEELTNNLPILAVDEWDEFLNLSLTQKLNLFEVLRRRPTEMAHLNYWRVKLR